MNDTFTAPVGANNIIKLARGVRLREDTIRGQVVLLAPERAIALDEIALQIVKALDGVRSIEQITDEFSRSFDATKDEIMADILAFVSEFLNRRMLEIVS